MQQQDLYSRVPVRYLLNCLLILLNIGLFASFFDVWWLEQQLDKGKIVPDSGFRYLYKITVPPFLTSHDSPVLPSASHLELYENKKPLGPRHSIHDAILKEGKGRYSHWRGYLYFSSSDNSDAIQNEQVYTIKYPVKPRGYLFGLALALLVVSILGVNKAMRLVLLPCGFALLGLSLAIVPFEAFLRTDYAKLQVIGAFGNFPSRITPTLNSKGYRDVEHDLKKRSGQIRILVFGDSMTFGWGIADDEIYPRLLEDLLGHPVEVISLARNGWSTADELLALRREGLAYKPDIVVVGVVTNDPGPLSIEPSGQEPEWVIFRRLLLDLQTWRFFDHYVNRLGDMLRLRYTYPEWENDIFDPRKKYRAKWEQTVQEFSRVLKFHNIPGYAFILISPVGPESTVQIRKYEILYEVFSNAGFHTTNLWEAYMREFRDVSAKTLWALPDDAHPGAEINRFFAHEIWKVLRSKIN